MDRMSGMGGMGGMGELPGMGGPTNPNPSGIADIDPVIAEQIYQAMDQYGLSPEQAMAYVMSQRQGMHAGAEQYLGLPADNGQTSMDALASMFGLSGTPAGVDSDQYGNEYDIANILAGGHGYES